ncbi:MAG: diacylglycerol kinase [Actinomycetes bacterium]
MLHRIALLVNPTSGKGRAARYAGPVADRLGSHGAEVVTIVGTDAVDAEDRARKAVADGTDTLVALGGDGIVHTAIQAVAGTGVPLGVVGAGTGNDLARELCIPTDPLAAADLVLSATPRPIDAVRSDNGRWFGGVLGSGFDSMVNERANVMSWPKGKSRYNLAILAELRVFKPLPFRLTLDGEVWDTHAMLVAVGNGTSYGAGMRVCPNARLDDGLLDVTVLGPVSKTTFIRTFPNVYKGTHVRRPEVTVRQAREVRLESPGVVAYADGERFAPLPLTCTCVPGALTVLAP